MDLSKKIRIGTVVGVLALAVIVPATVAWAQAGDEAPADGEGLICFEVGDLLPGPGPGLPFGDFDLEGLGLGDLPFDLEGLDLGGLDLSELPFDLEGLDLEGLDLGELPFDLEGLDLEGFDLGELPAPREILEQLNAEAEALADYLTEAGIEHELETGPFGVTWVMWDFGDAEANQAVDEFYEERGGPFDIMVEGLAFDLEGLDLEEMLGELPFDLEDFDLEEMLGDLDIEGFLEDFDLGELLFGDGFIFEMPFDGGFPMSPEALPFGDEPIWGHGEICFESIAARADGLDGEASELAAALEEAGIDVTYDTVEIRIPVWDEDAEGARKVVEEFYAQQHGLFGGFELDIGEFPFSEEGDDHSDGDDRSGALKGLPWNLEQLAGEGDR